MPPSDIWRIVNVSDQDFFFDEDEPTKEAAPTNSPSKTSTTTSRATAAAPAVGMADQSVSLMVTILVGVVTALLGVIIGIFVGRGLATTAVPGVGSGASLGTGTTQEAPQLSPDQLEGGELPAGHPPIGDGAAGATGTAPSKESTNK
jgi:hypothetical protein